MSEFFLQTGFSGNDMLFWKTGRHGYTTNIDEAHRFTESEARGQERMRPEIDKAWPCEQIESVAHRAVRIGSLPEKDCGVE